ncbi:MAG: MaoC family dehydratase [Acidimicrobiales bacterium]
MASNVEDAFEALKATEGTDEGTGDWFEVTQELVDDFADLTDDHQWIHVDPQRAKVESPFGTTIAHGFLTLSMLTHLASSVPATSAGRLEGIVMGMNYGFDKVRFVSPVKVGAKIRAASTVKSVQTKGPDSLQVTKTYTIEVEGEDRPAVVADWVTLLFFA